MNLFRISVMVLALSLIAGAVVHIRLKNWNYAYRINKLYEKHQRLQHEYLQAQLELARYQSPDNLLGRLKELKLPLEGFGLSTEAEENSKKPADKTPVKNTAKTPTKPTSKTTKSKSRT